MLIGHEKLIENFKQLAGKNALSHGYLFSGPARVGKKLFALCFANFLETGEFDSSSLISGGEIKEGAPSLLRDGLLLEPGENQTTRGDDSAAPAAKHSRTIGIDEIRRIRNFLWQKPIASGKRTVIINDAETMTGEAQNALLKIVEEPPESSLLIFIARDSEKLLPALQSRLQKIYFFSVSLPLVENWLREKFGCEKEQSRSAAVLSSGQPGLAWRMLFDERFRGLRKSGESFLKSGFWERREMVKALLEPDDFNLNEFLEILLMILSFDKLRMVSGVEPSGGQPSAKINPKLWHRILDLRRNADYLNLNPRLQLENLLND